MARAAAVHHESHSAAAQLVRCATAAAAAKAPAAGTESSVAHFAISPASPSTATNKAASAPTNTGLAAETR